MNLPESVNFSIFFCLCSNALNCVAHSFEDDSSTNLVNKNNNSVSHGYPSYYFFTILFFSHFSGYFIVFPSFAANAALLKGTQSVVIVIEEGTVHSSLPDQRTIMCVNKTSQLVWFPALFTAGDPPAED